MENTFIKKLWTESNIVFYLHFQDGVAIRQIEISEQGSIYLSASNPIEGDSMLYDQSLDELELLTYDFITEQEFELVWKLKCG